MKYNESEHLKALQDLQAEMRAKYEAKYLELAKEHRGQHSPEDVGIFDKDILEPLDIITNTDAAPVERLIGKAVYNAEFTIEFLEDDILPQMTDTSESVVVKAITLLKSFVTQLEIADKDIDGILNSN